MSQKKNRVISSTYQVDGMHCASCEILVEKKVLQEKTVVAADASLSKKSVTIKHQKGDKITSDYLTKLFAPDGYRFSSTDSIENTPPAPEIDIFEILLYVLLFIGGFFLLEKLGITNWLSVNSSSSLPIFLLFGVLAGFSSCAALVGGIVLSLSKQWLSAYGDSDSLGQKLQPHFLFNLGRLLGFSFFGALLGSIGGFFSLSVNFTAFLIISISAIMALLGLQMLGLKSLAGLQIRLPKFITGRLADETNFRGRLSPLLMGAATFFLPCGFTLSTQTIALASGNPVLGAIIMGLFALGTSVGLLTIGFSSVKLYSNPQVSHKFSLVAGILVLFFSIYNIHNQLTVLGLPSFSSAATNQPSTPTASIVDGKQVVQMTATIGGYRPNSFTVKAGIPVSWQIYNDGSAGCGAFIIAPSLFPERLDTVPYEYITKEFVPTTPGTYRFSCTMGMYTGSFTVVN